MKTEEMSSPVSVQGCQYTLRGEVCGAVPAVGYEVRREGFVAGEMDPLVFVLVLCDVHAGVVREGLIGEPYRLAAVENT